MISSQQKLLIVGGAVKSGTTSLFENLSRIDGLVGSRVKETCHYLPARYGGPVASRDVYARYFGFREGIWLESTPGYLDGGRSVASRIRDDFPEARLVFVLRDPVERFYSFLDYKKAQGELAPSLTPGEYLKECLELPEERRRREDHDAWWGMHGGMYGRYLEQWLEIFGASRIHIVFFERLVADPAAACREVLDWMGLHDARIPDQFSVSNRSIMYRRIGPHRLAIKANAVLEPVLRRFPGAKAGLRALYYSLNGRIVSRTRDSQVSAMLREFYAQEDPRLGAVLSELGLQNRPTWVTHAQLNAHEDRP